MTNQCGNILPYYNIYYCVCQQQQWNLTKFEVRRPSVKWSNSNEFHSLSLSFRLWSVNYFHIELDVLLCLLSKILSLNSTTRKSSVTDGTDSPDIRCSSQLLAFDVDFGFRNNGHRLQLFCSSTTILNRRSYEILLNYSLSHKGLGKIYQKSVDTYVHYNTFKLQLIEL